MNTQDGNQWSAPESRPKGKGQEPRSDKEDLHDIRKGARQEDQLEKLQPDDEGKAPGNAGSPPAGHVDQGND